MDAFKVDHSEPAPSDTLTVLERKLKICRDIRTDLDTAEEDSPALGVVKWFPLFQEFVTEMEKKLAKALFWLNEISGKSEKDLEDLKNKSGHGPDGGYEINFKYMQACFELARRDAEKPPKKRAKKL